MTWKGIPAWRLSAGPVEAVLTPQGGKVQSLRLGGRELLWQGKNKTYRTSQYGDVFETGEFSGFDDMFPNISAGRYPGGLWDGTLLPDHGEVWTQPWRDAETDGGLELTVCGVRLPYRLTKKAVVTERSLELSYEAENLTAHPMQYLWAAHPLFLLEDGMTLELPGAKEIVNTCGGCKSLGPFGEHHPWPVSKDGRDLSRLTTENQCYNKYYVWNPLDENLSRLWYPNGLTVTLRADPVSAVPYLGVWTDEGGYGGYGMACAAPEPCTAPMDRLDAAALFGKESVLPPHGSARWRLIITMEMEGMR